MEPLPAPARGDWIIPVACAAVVFLIGCIVVLVVIR
jgi:hypothetical protein